MGKHGAYARIRANSWINSLKALPVPLPSCIISCTLQTSTETRHARTGRCGRSAAWACCICRPGAGGRFELNFNSLAIFRVLVSSVTLELGNGIDDVFVVHHAP